MTVHLFRPPPGLAASKRSSGLRFKQIEEDMVADRAAQSQIKCTVTVTAEAAVDIAVFDDARPCS